MAEMARQPEQFGPPSGEELRAIPWGGEGPDPAGDSHDASRTFTWPARSWGKGRLNSPLAVRFRVDVDPEHRGELARVGSFALPPAYTVVPSDKSLPVIDVVVEHGRPACVAVRRRDGGAALRTKILRDTNLDTFIDWSSWLMAHEEVVDQHGLSAWRPVRGSGDSTKRAIAAARRPRGPRSLDDAHLAEVAQVYRDAIGLRRKDPVRAVAEKFHTSRSNAGKWVQKARSRDLLPATRQRQAKA